MAGQDFTRAEARILVYEGGKVDDPQDPGGRTNQGVTQATYNAWRRSQNLPTRDVFVMEPAERDAIYRKNYWNLVRADELPIGLDLVVFDAAVNSGVGQAIKWLQGALGDAYQGQRDGVLGDKTMQAIADCPDASELVTEFCAHRLATLKRLKTYKRFGKGWSARIANVQKTALAWIDNAPAPAARAVSLIDGHRKATVFGNLSEPVINPIVTHVVAGAGSVSTVATETAQQIAGVGVDWAWLKYTAAGLTCAAIVAGIVIKFGQDATKLASNAGARAEVDPEADSHLPEVSEPMLEAA